MKESFKEGVWVRFKLKDGSSGALARITEPKERYNQPGWKVRGYMGEGFYHITIIPDQRNLIVCEDDLVLVDRGVVNGIPIGVGTEDLIRNNGLPADDQEREDADRLVRVAAPLATKETLNTLELKVDQLIHKFVADLLTLCKDHVR